MFGCLMAGEDLLHQDVNVQGSPDLRSSDLIVMLNKDVPIWMGRSFDIGSCHSPGLSHLDESHDLFIR